MENLISMGFSCTADKPGGEPDSVGPRSAGVKPTDCVVLRVPALYRSYDRGRNFQEIIARIEGALSYVSYLNRGGKAFDDVPAVARTESEMGVTRSQSLHDKVLGELNARVLHVRLVETAVKIPTELALTKEGLYQLYAGLAGDVVERPYNDGFSSCEERETCCACAAFDYAKGWNRSDYVRRFPQARLSESAANDAGVMWGGSRGDVFGFNVLRHTGAGIELAFKARTADGGDCPIVCQESDFVRYRAPAGSDTHPMPWGPSPRWYVDFSVCTAMRGVEHPLDDFRFVLSVDICRASSATKPKRFVLTKPSALYHPSIGEIDTGRSWLLNNECDQIVLNADGTLFGGFGDEVPETMGSFVSQGSVNLGFKFMRRLFESHEGRLEEPRFGPGLFDIQLEAFDRNGGHLVNNHIQVQVE